MFSVFVRCCVVLVLVFASFVWSSVVVFFFSVFFFTCQSSVFFFFRCELDRSGTKGIRDAGKHTHTCLGKNLTGFFLFEAGC